MGLADLEARGLYDAATPDADERRAVLEFLLAQGVTPEEIQAAEAEGRLGSIFTDRIVGRPLLTLEDVAARTHQSAESIARVWRASGFPDPEPGTPVFTESDAEAVAVFGFALRVFGEEPALQLVRVMGSSAARIAEAELAAALGNVEGAYFPTAASPLDALRTSAALHSLLPSAEQAISHLTRRHLVAANRRFEGAHPAGAARPDVVELTVGFADLVGFTELSQELGPAELARALVAFDAITADVVTQGGGRLVKSMGDGVMFVARGAEPGCEIALALRDALDAADALPAVRVGVAAGEVIARDGDYFGPVVNLAARLAAVASPGAVVVAASVRDQVASRYGLEALGPRRLRGFPEPVDAFRLLRS